MSSWGNNDNAANSPFWAATSVNLTPNSANATALFDNTTANTFAANTSGGGKRYANVTVGLFGIDPYEAQVAELDLAGKITHAGWNLVTTFQGGRAGRIQTECLVTLANLIGDSDGQTYANVVITLVGPSSQSVNSNSTYSNVATFTVTPSLLGNTSANLTYTWQYNNASGSLGWTAVSNTATANIYYSGNTSATLTARPKDTSNNNTILRVVVNAADEGVSATSANATLSIPS